MPEDLVRVSRWRYVERIWNVGARDERNEYENVKLVLRVSDELIRKQNAGSCGQGLAGSGIEGDAQCRWRFHNRRDLAYEIDTVDCNIWALLETNASTIRVFLKEVKPSAKGNCKKISDRLDECAAIVCTSPERQMRRGMSQNNQDSDSKERRESPIEAPQIQTRLPEKRDGGGKQGGCGANVRAGVLRSNDNAAWGAVSLPTNGTRDGPMGAEIHRCANGWWRDAGERREASLAWSLNDVFGDVFWIGGAFKISAQVIGDTGQLMGLGPILVKATINFARARAAAWETGGDPVHREGCGYGVWTHRCCPAAECLSELGVWSQASPTTRHIYRCLLSMLYGLPRFKVHKRSLLLCNLKILNDNHTHHLLPHPANPAGVIHTGWVLPLRIHRPGPGTYHGETVQDEWQVDEVYGIYDIRANEVRGIRNIQHVQSANIAVAFSLPILASTLRSLSNIADARNALGRFKAVFNAQTLDEAPFKIDPAQEYALDAQGVSFEWESTMKEEVKGKGKAGRRRWCLKRRRRRWWRREESRRRSGRSRCRTSRCASRAGRSRASLGVSGLGAGKSSLMQGLIGEMGRIGGELSFGGGVAYYTQTTWIRNATVRENVLFGKPFKSDRYWRIMEAACLLPGLQLLSDGDLTEIGEKGINLSGGQKQHVNIARAVYYDADIVIFDHPLLAVGERREGPFPERHAHPGACDYIYTLDGGRVAEQDTYQQLIARGGEFLRLDKEFGGTTVEEPTENVITVTVTVEDLKAKSAKAAGTGKILLNIAVAVYTSYIKAAHGRATAKSLHHDSIISSGMVFSLVVMQIFTETIPWGRIVGVFGKDTDTTSAPDVFLWKFLTCCCQQSIIHRPWRCACTLCGEPPGATRWLIRHAVRSGYRNWWLIWWLHYCKLSVLDEDIGDSRVCPGLFYSPRPPEEPPNAVATPQRMPDEPPGGSRWLTAKSLLFQVTHRSEQFTFIHLSSSCSFRSANDSQLCQRYNNFRLSFCRWLAIRLNACGALMVFVVCFTPRTPKLTQMCNAVTRQTGELENYMNSVDRNARKDFIPQEVAYESDKDHKPLADWPRRGAIEFKDVEMQYRPGVPKVLHGISMNINRGERIGVVGRTGTGKSSLTLTLLRIVGFEGEILVDDVDISKIGLKDRRANISIIPQDPILFSGTVRTVLDLFNKYDDARLWDALRRPYLVDSGTLRPIDSLELEDDQEEQQQSRIYLDTVVEIDGANLSVGQRSFLSLALALVPVNCAVGMNRLDTHSHEIA
ncbi:hypothetical protein B0H19DRAFT_1083174 [Mycena capillaripes]|nr:hypothetical protein B0H19DRAFT_1083174 [Mycena capillaripes]